MGRPEKEFDAMLTAMRAGLLSRSQAISAFGYDAEDIDREIAADNQRADELGLRFDSDPRHDRLPTGDGKPPAPLLLINGTPHHVAAPSGIPFVRVPLLITRTKLDVILAVLGPRIGLPSVQATPSCLPRVCHRRRHVPVLPRFRCTARWYGAASGWRPPPARPATGILPCHWMRRWPTRRSTAFCSISTHPGGEAGAYSSWHSGFALPAGSSRYGPMPMMQPTRRLTHWGCAASRLTVSATGGIGSIGVIALHVDQSLKDSQDGVAYTAIYAGQHKNDFSPHAPLSPQAAQSLQTEVDRLYALFVEHVAQMRKLDPGLGARHRSSRFMRRCGGGSRTGRRDQQLQPITRCIHPASAAPAFVGGCVAPSQHDSNHGDCHVRRNHLARAHPRWRRNHPDRQRARTGRSRA